MRVSVDGCGGVSSLSLTVVVRVDLCSYLSSVPHKDQEILGEIVALAREAFEEMPARDLDLCEARAQLLIDTRAKLDCVQLEKVWLPLYLQGGQVRFSPIVWCGVGGC